MLTFYNFLSWALSGRRPSSLPRLYFELLLLQREDAWVLKGCYAVGERDESGWTVYQEDVSDERGLDG